MVLIEATLFQEFGPAIALMIIMVIGGKWVLNNAFEQVEIARKDFTNFVELTTKEQTKAITKLAENVSLMSADLEQHTRAKEQFIDTINEQRKTINELFTMLKDQIKTNKH